MFVARIESRCVIKAKHVLQLVLIALKKLHLRCKALVHFPTQIQMNKQSSKTRFTARCLAAPKALPKPQLFIAICTPDDKLQWKFKQHTAIFIEENAFKTRMQNGVYFVGGLSVLMGIIHLYQPDFVVSVWKIIVRA